LLASSFGRFTPRK